MPRCIGNLFDLKDKHKGKDFLVLGAASTVKYYKDEILSFIKNRDLIVIGINNMTHILKPDYHLWTNNQRLRDFNSCIDRRSIVILGSNILEKTIKNINVDYYKINYIDKAFKGIYESPLIKTDCLSGSFRVAGNIAVLLSSILGGNNVYYAGVDGYSKPFNGDQHCYGSGLTDSNDIQYEIDKDAVIYNCLKAIHKKIPFKIITPTLFKEFYDKTILATDR